MKKDNDPGIATAKNIGNLEEKCREIINNYINQKEDYMPTPESVKMVTEQFKRTMTGRPAVIMQDVRKDIKLTVRVFGGLYGDIAALYRLIKTSVIDLNRLHDSEYVGGTKEQVIYIFLGNYSEYGIYGVTVMYILYLLKIAYPTHVFLLRGPIELKLDYMFVHNLRRQCDCRYEANGKAVYDMLTDTYDFLELAIRLNKFMFFGGGPPVPFGTRSPSAVPVGEQFGFLLRGANLPLGKFVPSTMVTCATNRAYTGETFDKAGLDDNNGAPICYYGKLHVLNFCNSTSIQVVFSNSLIMTTGNVEHFIGCISSSKPLETIPVNEDLGYGYWELNFVNGEPNSAKFMKMP